MANLQAIREALAANLAVLRTNETVVQVSAYMLDNPTPPSLMVAGIDADGYEEQAYTGESISYTLLIEACLGKIEDTSAQRLLNKLLSPPSESTSLIAAVKADPLLTSRLGDNGQVTSGQAAAASSIAFAGYRGQTPFVLQNGSRVLLATWAFTVFA